MTETRRTRRFPTAILLIGLLAGCTAARIDPPAPPVEADATVARKEFQEAMSLAREGRMAAAAPHYRKAAENGHAEAQYVLATMYRTGRGMSRDVDQAVMWYGRSANAGYPLAQFTLGNIHNSGQARQVWKLAPGQHRVDDLEAGAVDPDDERAARAPGGFRGRRGL